MSSKHSCDKSTQQLAKSIIDDEWAILKQQYSMPDSQQHYNEYTGLAGELCFGRLAKELLVKEYEDVRLVHNFFPTNNTDITIFSHDNVLLKMEVLNWWLRTYLTQERAFSIRNNLKDSPYKTLCITSQLNLKPSSTRILKGIPIYYAGYQILPQAYYEYFKEKNPNFALFRAIFNEETIEHQKKQISGFFKEIDLI